MNETIFNKVVSEAKAKAAGNAEWLRAIDKAAAGILTDSVCVTLFADDTALVTTTNGSYRVNGTCPCPARTAHCYHRAAKRLWTLYEEAACKAALPAELRRDVATTPRKQLIIEIKAAWPKDWPLLEDELMRRFHCNRLDYLDDGALCAIRLAIAA